MTSFVPLASILLASVALTPAPDGVFHDLSLKEALALAKSEHKVVFVDFFTTWCGPCKKLDRTTWVDAGVVAWLSANTIPIKLDAEIATAAATNYRVESYPTMIFIDADGSERGRITGFRDPQGFLSEAPARLAGRTELDEIERKLVDSERDPSLRMTRGAALASAGRYEEALVDYLFCLDEGIDTPSFSGVRLSFLLTNIERLGSDYPPALEALRERADTACRRLLDGVGGVAEARDAAALNRTLGRNEKTLELYDALRVRKGVDPQARDRLFDSVVDMLLDAARYQDVVDGGGDILARVERDIEYFAQIEEMFKDDSPEMSPVDFMRKSTVSRSVNFYHALLGIQSDETAEFLAARLIEFDPSGATFGQLTEAAIQLERFSTAHALLKRGFETVATDKQAALHDARSRLEKAEKSEAR